MRHPPTPVQLPLFGPVAVHIARRGNCAVCRAYLAVAADWSRLEGCHDCPGLVEPADPRAVLGGYAVPLEHLEAA
jgi:hypothetical protein